MNTILMVYPALATWLALLLYLGLAINVAKARRRHQIHPPFTDGPEDFLRYYRVHQNMAEQMILFLPSLWLFSFYYSPVWGGILGGLWVLARMVYAIGYYQNWEKRLPGFIASIFIIIILMLGSLFGLLKVLSVF